ncbi:MAG TPA: hypothetical protein VFR67_03565 [Pilimelia sp.]|nr:hypothetical protein [Pilimelia sp.]
MVVRAPRGGDARAAYLPELASLVWPAPADAALRRGGRAGYVVVPSAARPRLLVPAGAPRAAAGAILRATEAAGTKARLERRLLAAAFRAGVGPLALRDRLVVDADGTGLDAHLADILGRPVLLSLHIGPARANRKPVIQLLGRRGEPLGFAKLGVDPLTRALVDAEAAALGRLAELKAARASGGAMEAARASGGAMEAATVLGPVTVADVLHHGVWGGHALLVQSALPVRLPRAAGPAAVAAERAAMVAVAGCLGTPHEAYAGSAYAVRLAAEVDALGERPEAHRLRAVLATVAGRNPVLAFGCWHGDWNGGNNAALADGRMLVWDWERFATGVPVGYDPLHLALQTAITRAGTPPVDAARALLTGADSLLDGFGQPAGSTDLVAVLYLVELAVRYLRDRQAEAGARLGHIGAWLLPVVEEHLAGRGRAVEGAAQQ